MARGRSPHKASGPHGKSGGSRPEAVSPFDFAAVAAEISDRKESQLIPELLETVARRRDQDVGSGVATGSHWVDTELVAATAQIVSDLSQRHKLIESPIAAAITVAAHNFDLTETRTETVLAALLHRFSDDPDKIRRQILTRLQKTRKKGSVRNPDAQNELDNKRVNALNTAFSIAIDAAKITLTPRKYAVDAGVSAEDFANTCEAIISFPRPEVALVKVADAESGLARIDRVPCDEQASRLAIIEGAYIPLADALGWTRMANRMRDMVLTKRAPFVAKELTDQIERLPGFKGLYSDPKIHKALTIDLPQIIKGELLRYVPLDSEQILVSGRRKSLYGVAKKKLDKGYGSLEEMPDILALRVVIPDGKDHTEDHESCLKLMAAFKKIGFKPIPGEYTDHISNPDKPYQSLHNVFMYKGMKIEVQVRTMRMHWEAELKPGVSHFDYAEGSRDKTGNAAVHSNSYLVRVEQVRAGIAARLQGTRLVLPSQPENIFCFDADGRATKLPNIGPSIMDALINMYSKPKDNVTATDVAHASHVYLNGSKLRMDNPATRAVEIENGDSLRVDPADVDRFRRIEPKWKVATQYARGILVKEIKAQRVRTIGASKPDFAFLGHQPSREP